MTKVGYACADKGIARELFQNKGGATGAEPDKAPSSNQTRVVALSASLGKFVDSTTLESCAAQIKQMDVTNKTWVDTAAVNGQTLSQITVYNGTQFEFTTNQLVHVEFKGGYWWCISALEMEAGNGDVLYATNDSAFSSGSVGDVNCTVLTDSPTQTPGSTVAVQNCGIFSADADGETVVAVYSNGKYRMVNISCPDEGA